MKDKNSCKKPESFYEKANNFLIYGTMQNITNAYHNGQSISVILDCIDKVFGVIGDNIYCSFIIGYLNSICMGHNYFQIEAQEKRHIDLKSFEIVAFGLLLPKLSGNDENEDMTENGIYTIITSDWTEVQQGKSFGFYNYNNV